MLEKLIEDDSNFNLDMFKTKVDNMFILLFLSITNKKLDRVMHFLNQDMRAKYENLIDDLDKRNLIQIYEELNVSETNILEINELKNSYEIKVYIKSKSIDYLIDARTKKFVKGENTRRTEKDNYLTLIKYKNTKKIKLTKKCPGCGANINVNANGKCEYCSAIFDQENYDWVISNVEVK